MELSVEEQGNLKRKITVEVPLSEVKLTYEEVYSQIKGHIKVDGFRPGKVPRDLVEKRFKDVMKQEATRSLLPKYFDEALKEMKAMPATQPNFSNLEIDQKKPFKFEAEFEIIPSFDLPDPSDFALEVKEPEIDPKDIEKRIEDLRSSSSQLEEKKDGKVEDGDVITIDFEGKIDGEPFEGNTGKDFKLGMGAGQFLKDFEEALIGMKKNETKTFDLTFPDEYDAPLGGKTTQFEVTIKSMEKKVLPEINQAFFSRFGDFKTLEDFREDISSKLKEEKKQEIELDYQEKIAEQVKEKYDFEVPESLVENFLENYRQELYQKEPKILDDEEKFTKLIEEQTNKIKADLRLNYVIDELAKVNKIKVSKEEVSQQFFYQAYMMRQNPDELSKTPQGDQMRYQIEQQLVSNKVLEQIANKILGKPETKPTGDDPAPDQKSGTEKNKEEPQK